MTNHVISKEQFDLLYQGNDIVFLFKKEDDFFEYIYLNEQAKAFVPSESIGECMPEHFPDEIYKQMMSHFNKAIQENQQIEYIADFYEEAGLRHFETTVKPIFYKEHVYILASLKELSNHQSFLENSDFVRLLFKNTFFPSAMLSKEGTILEINTRFTEEFDVTLPEINQKRLVELPILTPLNMAEFENSMKQLQMGEVVSTSIFSFHGKNDCKTSYLATFLPVMAHQKMTAVLVLMQNIPQYIEPSIGLHSILQGYESIKAALHLVADIAILDTKGNIIEVNGQFLSTCRYDMEELVGRNFQFLSARYHNKQFFKEMWDTLLAGEVWRGEICNETKFGENYWVDAKIIPLKNEKGIIQTFLIVQYNISDKKTMMTELKNIERRFRVITENTNDLIVITNEDGIILYTSPSYAKKLGYTMFELVGHFYEDIVSEDSKEDWRAVFANQDTFGDDGDTQLDLRLKSKDGKYIWTDGLISIVKGQEQSNSYQFVMVSRESTQRKELEKQLEFMAYHDSLTQLPNRRYLVREFPSLIKKANLMHHSMAVLFIDGDDFKYVNDQFGHDIGDAFIREFGSAVSKSLRTQDLVIRLGGDEFIVILTGLATNHQARVNQIKQIIQRIQSNLQKGWFIEDIHFSPTSSMGVACYPDHAEDLDELLEIADHALYEAKKIGKNSCKFADTSL